MHVEVALSFVCGIWIDPVIVVLSLEAWLSWSTPIE